jgi:predicted DNA-binding transcriptional regulator AlpA
VRSLNNETVQDFSPKDPSKYGFKKVAYSVNETLDLLSIGRTTLYRLIATADLKPTKLGKKTLFLATDLAGLVERLKANKRGNGISHPSPV